MCSVAGGTSSHAFASADPSGRSDGGELLDVCSLVEAGRTKPAFPCGCPPIPLPRGRLPCPPLGLSGVFFLFLLGVISELLPVISFPFNKRG